MSAAFFDGLVVLFFAWIFLVAIIIAPIFLYCTLLTLCWRKNKILFYFFLTLLILVVGEAMRWLVANNPGGWPLDLLFFAEFGARIMQLTIVVSPFLMFFALCFDWLRWSVKRKAYPLAVCQIIFLLEIGFYLCWFHNPMRVFIGI